MSLTPIKTNLIEKFQNDFKQNSSSEFEKYKQIYNKDKKIKFPDSSIELGHNFILNMLKNVKEIIKDNSQVEICGQDKRSKIIEALYLENYFDNEMKEKLLKLL